MVFFCRKERRTELRRPAPGREPGGWFVLTISGLKRFFFLPHFKDIRYKVIAVIKGRTDYKNLMPVTIGIGKMK